MEFKTHFSPFLASAAFPAERHEELVFDQDKPRGGHSFMISQAVEYSLRAMGILAESTSTPLTVQLISERGQIPAAYLSKLLQGLTRAGLVTAQRGVGGGYTLARPAAEITLADVVQVVEPLQRITRCPLGKAGHITLCPLHRRLDQALATIEQAFRSTTLADLCNEAEGSAPLCPRDIGVQPTIIR